MKLLSASQSKMSKSYKLGYLSAILHLSPANESGLINTCPWASKECAAVCLKTAGMMRFKGSVAARIERTRLYVQDRFAFYSQLHDELTAHQAKADKLGMIATTRLDGTSDLGIAEHFADLFPRMIFIDYTKSKKRAMSFGSMPINRYITFSYSGHNLSAALECLSYGVNVAVVFDTKRGDALPETWNGYPVIDGDENDLRHLDAPGVVVGLRAKGTAVKLKTGTFVQIAGVAA
jgi:hypothetical protein